MKHVNVFEDQQDVPSQEKQILRMKQLTIR